MKQPVMLKLPLIVQKKKWGKWGRAESTPVPGRVSSLRDSLKLARQSYGHL
jgi:hypothetical protein